MYNKQEHDKITTKSGLKKDQEGIIQRYFREKEHWDIHLNRTRSVIKKFTANKKGNVIIFGSGWLLDVPIDFLSKTFQKVYLADIRHPIQVQKKMKSFPNVEFLTLDLTGGLISFALANKRNSLIADNYINHYTDPDIPEDSNYFISCNIFNQLDILLWETAKKTISEEEFSIVRSFVQKSHLNILPAGKSCLITDVQQTTIDLRNPSFSESSSSLYTSLPKTNNTESWEWVFDTAGRYIKGKEIRFQVQALLF
jgi:hypothetical protein